MAGWFPVAQPGARRPGWFLAIFWIGGLSACAGDEVKFEAVGTNPFDVKASTGDVCVIDGAEGVRCYGPAAGVVFTRLDICQASIFVVAFGETIAV